MAYLTSAISLFGQSSLKQDIMTLKLNVLITITDSGRVFSVWSDCIKEVPWINLYEGHGDSLSDALEDYFLNLPANFIIDDERMLHPCDINYALKRPFKTIKSNSVRLFKLN